MRTDPIKICIKSIIADRINGAYREFHMGAGDTTESLAFVPLNKDFSLNQSYMDYMFGLWKSGQTHRANLVAQMLLELGEWCTKNCIEKPLVGHDSSEFVDDIKRNLNILKENNLNYDTFDPFDL